MRLVLLFILLRRRLLRRRLLRVLLRLLRRLRRLRRRRLRLRRRLLFIRLYHLGRRVPESTNSLKSTLRQEKLTTDKRNIHLVFYHVKTMENHFFL